MKRGKALASTYFAYCYCCPSGYGIVSNKYVVSEVRAGNYDLRTSVSHDNLV